MGLNDIKSVFNQYLDINISDNDILEFIEEADGDKDGYLNQSEFFTKLGYQWFRCLFFVYSIFVSKRINWLILILMIANKNVKNKNTKKSRQLIIEIVKGSQMFVA